jgi:hypothetical protein
MVQASWALIVIFSSDLFKVCRLGCCLELDRYHSRLWGEGIFDVRGSLVPLYLDNNFRHSSS